MQFMRNLFNVRSKYTRIYMLVGANTHAACVYNKKRKTERQSKLVYLQEKRFANASLPLLWPFSHRARVYSFVRLLARALVQKINRNHVNNFHRLSSRLSWLVFHDIYLLQSVNIDWLQVWATKERQNGQLCSECVYSRVNVSLALFFSW